MPADRPPHIKCMTIVTASPPKRRSPEKRAQPMQLQQAVITARKPGKPVQPAREIDPDADVRAKAFLERMIVPPGR